MRSPPPALAPAATAAGTSLKPRPPAGGLAISWLGPGMVGVGLTAVLLSGAAGVADVETPANSGPAGKTLTAPSIAPPGPPADGPPAPPGVAPPGGGGGGGGGT